MIKVNENIHITIFPLFATGKGTKEPCFRHWLRGKVIGNGFCYFLCAHFNLQSYALFSN